VFGPFCLFPDHATSLLEGAWRASTRLRVTEELGQAHRREQTAGLRPSFTFRQDGGFKDAQQLSATDGVVSGPRGIRRESVLATFGSSAQLLERRWVAACGRREGEMSATGTHREHRKLPLHVTGAAGQRIAAF
jgi:hypothetical protein